MIFTISQSALLRALQVTSKTVGSNATMPILGGVLIRAEGSEVSFTTTDLNSSATHATNANVEEEGAVVLSHRTLLGVVKYLPDAAVTVTSTSRTEGGRAIYDPATIECGKSKTRLNAMNPSDFPEFDAREPDSTVELPTDKLASLVDYAGKAVSSDAARPILAGMQLTASDGVLRAVATDSYRLVVCDTQVDVDGDFEAVVPGKAFSDALSVASSPTMTIEACDGQMRFVMGRTSFVTRRIDGSFPDYRKLVPQASNAVATVDAESLAQAVRTVSVVATSNPSVRMCFDNSLMPQLTLQASQADQGESTQVIDIEYQGEGMTVAVNWHYLADSLHHITGEVTVELMSAMQPVILKRYGDVNAMSLMMPVRL